MCCISLVILFCMLSLCISDGQQEAIVIPPWVALAIRPRTGVWEYVRVNVSELAVEELSVPEYLQFKEELVDGQYVL